MADGYISAPFETDVSVLLERADQSLRAHEPAAQLADGSLIRWQVETDARTAADIATLALSVSEEVARSVLARLLDEPAWPAQAARSTATLTVTGDVTAVIPAGAYLEGTMPDGSPVTVATTTETTIPIPPDTTIPPGPRTETVDVVAVEPGTSANDAEGELLGMEIWPWGVSARLDEPLKGGVDAEDPLAHLDRLARLARLARPRPIKPDEFAQFVQLKVPGVGAAVALDKVRPGQPAIPEDPGPPLVPGVPAVPPATGIERCVTVGVRTLEGEPPSAEVIAQAQAALRDARETTFLSYVVAADYTTVDVNATVRVWPGYDEPQIEELAKAAIERYLDPATWGAPPAPGGAAAGDSPVWAQSTQVRVEEIVEALGAINAVDFAPIDSITIAGQPDEPGAPRIDGNPDLELPGLLPLPRPGEINILVEPR